MPRNGAGVYSLPAGNPVVPLTVIATSWANPTLDDIALALTNSLDRAGSGGMTGVLKVVDGLVGAPGMAFSADLSVGWFRESSLLSHLVTNGLAYVTIDGNADTVLFPRGISPEADFAGVVAGTGITVGSPGYLYKDPMGFVHFYLNLNCDGLTDTSALATFPAGYRPQADQYGIIGSIEPVGGGEFACEVKVEPSGLMSLMFSLPFGSASPPVNAYRLRGSFSTL